MRTGSSENFGSNARLRVFFLSAISLIAWTFAALLFIVLRNIQLPTSLSAWNYLLPLFHLLPWAAGIQCVRKIQKAFKSGVIDTASAGLSYSIAIALLSATYVVMCLGEVITIFAFRLKGFGLL